MSSAPDQTIEEWCEGGPGVREVHLVYRPLGHWPWVCDTVSYDTRRVAHRATGVGNTPEEAFAQTFADRLAPKVTDEREAALSEALRARAEERG